MPSSTSLTPLTPSFPSISQNLSILLSDSIPLVLNSPPPLFLKQQKQFINIEILCRTSMHKKDSSCFTWKQEAAQNPPILNPNPCLSQGTYTETQSVSEAQLECYSLLFSSAVPTALARITSYRESCTAYWLFSLLTLFHPSNPAPSS